MRAWPDPIHTEEQRWAAVSSLPPFPATPAAARRRTKELLSPRRELTTTATTAPFSASSFIPSSSSSPLLVSRRLLSIVPVEVDLNEQLMASPNLSQHDFGARSRCHGRVQRRTSTPAPPPSPLVPPALRPAEDAPAVPRRRGIRGQQQGVLDREPSSPTGVLRRLRRGSLQRHPLPLRYVLGQVPGDYVEAGTHIGDSAAVARSCSWRRRAGVALRLLPGHAEAAAEVDGTAGAPPGAPAETATSRGGSGEEEEEEEEEEGGGGAPGWGHGPRRRASRLASRASRATPKSPRSSRPGAGRRGGAAAERRRQQQRREPGDDPRGVVQRDLPQRPRPAAPWRSFWWTATGTAACWRPPRPSTTAARGGGRPRRLRVLEGARRPWRLLLRKGPRRRRPARHRSSSHCSARGPYLVGPGRAHNRPLGSNGEGNRAADAA